MTLLPTQYMNELVFTFSAPINYAKAQFNPIIISRVIEYTTYYYYMEADTFVKTVLPFFFSHKTHTFSFMMRM